MEPELKWSGVVSAIHHARWMNGGTATFKMVACGEERFPIGQMQAKGLLDLVFFIICIYGRYWFASPVTADAPFLTLALWKDLHSWAARDPALSACMLRTLDRHTWYLNRRNLSLSLFSRLVPDETKRKIADAILSPENEPCDIPLGKPDLPPISPDSFLEDFVTSETWFLFQVRLLPMFSFLYFFKQR